MMLLIRQHTISGNVGENQLPEQHYSIIKRTKKSEILKKILSHNCLEIMYV